MGRPAPNFWWEFDHLTRAVIVQSDWPGGERLAVFPITDESSDLQIAEAEALIADFKTGRKTPQWGTT